MGNHPNFDAAEAALQAARSGDYGPAFDAFTDDVIVENGPGAGPWHRATNKEDLALLLMEFAGALGNSFHQDGHCIYADDRVSINLIHETGKAPSGDVFDNLAVYVAGSAQTARRTGCGRSTSTPSIAKTSGGRT